MKINSVDKQFTPSKIEFGGQVALLAKHTAATKNEVPAAVKQLAAINELNINNGDRVHSTCFASIRERAKKGAPAVWLVLADIVQHEPMVGNQQGVIVWRALCQLVHFLPLLLSPGNKLLL